MKKKSIIIIISLAFFLTLSVVDTLLADIDPSIKINGELRNFSPAAIITDDRVMIPIRFVIEDEAFKGQVYWDEGLHKVAIDCGEKYIELFVGSNKAKVDGKSVDLDAAPLIYQDRTYIPLRFLAENMGAVVGWNSKNREVNINFNKPEVFAYYYYTPWQEMENNIDVFTDIAFRWFATNGKGHLYYEYEDDYQSKLEFARENGVRTHASIVLMNREKLHELFSSTKNRSQLIGNIMDKVNKDHYDGVNIDFEFIDYRDAALFTNFLKELKTSMGPDKILSVAVFGRTGKESWPSSYEYRKIGEVADKVVIMAYDYSYTDSAPGPVAPLWWVEDIADYMLDRIPQEKILLGVPTYGYDWSSDGTASTVTSKKLNIIKGTYLVREHFDTKSMSPYYTYKDKYGHNHQIWLENKKSLEEKLNVVVNNKLGGISFWRIGNGFNDLYEVLNEKLNN